MRGIELRVKHLADPKHGDDNLQSQLLSSTPQNGISKH
jgi:hypothetical protein